MKHWDFMLLDVIVLEIAFAVAFLLRTGISNPYEDSMYKATAVLVGLVSVCIQLFFQGYSGILRRGYWKEFVATLRHVSVVFACMLVYLFILKGTAIFSRLFLILFFFISVVLMYIERLSWKVWLRYHRGPATGKRSILLVGCEDNYKELIDSFRKNAYSEFFLAGACVLDADANNPKLAQYRGTDMFYNQEEALSYILSNWVDEVLISVPREKYFADKFEFMEKCSAMGVTTHLDLSKITGEVPYQLVERIEGYNVLSNSVSLVTTKQLVAKRMIDILGGIVGCILTGIIFLFVGPIIYIKSPGPIFFHQERVGRNGKKFQIYKFRSMYMDAEERKKELMEKNNIKDGMMFKMDNDPRIIKGIGNFIRDTSLDEFPQFWNVLKGDMSLIGTRPPTVDEWEKYDFEHRGRLAIKPGITGMWQVSGRSEITDFDEVVRLDKKYISEWSLGLDFRILVKTILVVVKKDGAQ
jgi:exopolysaccharide biosynthesis polyprenyl glycosylphosphotransferase